jgi:hypothetical protein
VGIDTDRESEIPLEDLGRSFLGFHQAIHDFTRIIGLNGEIRITAVTSSEGSQIIDAILELNLVLQMTSEYAWKEAIQFFNEIQNGLNQLNDYFAKRPFDLSLLALLISQLIQWVRSRKNHIPINDEHLAARIAKESEAIVKKRIFLEALRPIIEDSASVIEVSADRKFGPSAAKIDSASLADYLTPDLQILPDLHNGLEYKLQGMITSLKATRGESLTFQYWDGSKIYNLDAIPESGKSTKDYVLFYKESVQIKAEIERSSYFKKPKLHIHDISLVQPGLAY